MPDAQQGRRRSIRLKGYDYSCAGAYFVTVCVQDRACLLGDVSGIEMVTNPAGEMVRTVWEELPSSYPGVDIDEFVVMPNHVHGIIVLSPVGAAPVAAHPRAVAANRMLGNHGGLSVRGRAVIGVAGCRASVQNDDDEAVRRWRSAVWMVPVQPTIVAAQLL